MAARKRRENETFEKYRENLKKEEKELKKYLKGRVIWNQGTYKRRN